MPSQNIYIMRDQVRNLIPTIMKYDATGRPRRGSIGYFVSSVGGLVVLYFLVQSLSTP